MAKATASSNYVRVLAAIEDGCSDYDSIMKALPDLTKRQCKAATSRLVERHDIRYVNGKLIVDISGHINMCMTSRKWSGDFLGAGL